MKPGLHYHKEPDAAYAQQVMLETAQEFNEPVAPYRVARFKGSRIIFPVRTPGTCALKDFIHDHHSGESFFYGDSCSHHDLISPGYPPRFEPGTRPGFSRIPQNPENSAGC